MMHTAWEDISHGTTIGPFSFDLSVQANERYWHSAGVSHNVFVVGAAYPLIAANATVLTWLDKCATPMIQTRQHLECHGIAYCPVQLTTHGRVTDRFDRRGRTYISVATEISGAGQTLWTSTVDFTPTSAVIQETTREGRARSTPTHIDGYRKALQITADRIRQYSRRGNYHSDASTAEELGLPGLVAQGTQVCGPAFDLLADAWGERFIRTGVIDLQFVGMVTADEIVEATVKVDGDNAALQVWNQTKNRLAAVGTASLL